MPELDHEEFLVNQALDLHYDDFDLIDTLMTRTSNENTKKRLHVIRTTKFHFHEASCDSQ